MPRLFASIITSAEERVEGAQLTSFSDNVVASVPFDEQYLVWTLRSLGNIQLGAALAGFWIRGAVTIGELHHDTHIVFGPALNRAYFLESHDAKYPRIIFDPDAQELLAVRADFISEDDHFRFIDPFSVSFMREVRNGGPPARKTIERFNELANARIPTEPQFIDERTVLSMLTTRLAAEIAACAQDGPKEKLTWLLRRILDEIS
jgi:hypothetical protein